MENTGTWNSNVAIFYLIVFCFPTVILLIKFAILAFYEKVETVYVPVEKEVEVEKIVYVDRVIHKPEKKSKPKPKVSQTESSVLNDVVSGLVGLGIKRVDAKKIVKQVSAGKKYSDSERLMLDCVSKL